MTAGSFCDDHVVPAHRTASAAVLWLPAGREPTASQLAAAAQATASSWPETVPLAPFTACVLQVLPFQTSANGWNPYPACCDCHPTASQSEVLRHLMAFREFHRMGELAVTSSQELPLNSHAAACFPAVLPRKL